MYSALKLIWLQDIILYTKVNYSVQFNRLLYFIIEKDETAVHFKIRV